jgi:DNA gyrase subunit A
MAIYRMTKEEVEKRTLMIKEDKARIKEYEAILKSPAKIKKKLIEELDDVSKKLDTIMKSKEDAKKKVYKKLEKATKKKAKKKTKKK